MFVYLSKTFTATHPKKKCFFEEATRKSSLLTIIAQNKLLKYVLNKLSWVLTNFGHIILIN